MSDERHPLQTLAANTGWVEALLALFWACDAAISRGEELPPAVRQVYDKAEVARQQL